MTTRDIPALSGRLIHLDPPEGPLVFPHPADTPTFSFKPFLLPSYPMSQSCWLAGLMDMFHDRHQRCLVALLLIDLETSNWVMPIVPTQRCSAEGASFRLLETDFQCLPRSYRIAGTYQYSHAADDAEARTLVPPFDGLHMVHSRSWQMRNTFYFQVTKGTIRPVAPETVMFDDWQGFLRHFGERITLG